MSFIGVIASKKCFENIKKKVTEKIKDENINFIQINLRSIENVKNIKFETIIIEDNLEKFKNHQEILKKILENTQYMMINTDKNPEQENIKKLPNRITYGLNQKAMVTVSSISETDILVYWQKSLENREGKKVEIEERRIKKEESQLLKTYEILIIYTLFKLYHKSIMKEM
ncbi:MAG: hypothetical protein HFJ35_00100 [Clostridia bacterium]|nr:hypothetical protein [Clostridia bacterium]